MQPDPARAAQGRQEQPLAPEEDIAETFMYFIFTPKPSGTSIADQKISFFYDEGKMKDLRETLLSQLCRYTGKP